MSDTNKKTSCQIGCWAMGAAAGFLTFIMLMAVADYTFLAAAFVGVLVFVLLGLLFTWLFCASLPALGANAAPVKAESAPAPTAPAVAATAAASAAVADTSAADKAAADDAKAASAKADAEKQAAADKAKADKKAADKKVADDKAEADKKAASAKAAADKKAATAKAKADKAAAEAAATADYDGDGVNEGADEGTKPATLSAARAGGADDLKRIKGIGPKLEKLCNTMGFYHFDQIAGWSADEMAWVNANIEGFKCRATRDKWIEQATLLAAGEDTEFSKRVDKGSVY